MRARLVDTNVLVYRVDPRHRQKQQLAHAVLRDGLAAGDLVIPYQALVEFVPAVTRARPDLGGAPLMSREEALREVEELMLAFPVIYPGPEVLAIGVRGAAAYGLAWFDAQLWAYAEAHGIPEILSEDFAHGRYYGRVRATDPFLQAAGGVSELPPLYAT